MAYHLGLAEMQKARMEMAGRVALTNEESQRLQQTRMVYIPVVVGGIWISVIRRTLFFNIFSGFFILAIAEVVCVLLFVEMKQKPKQLAMALVRLVGGLMSFVVIMSAAHYVSMMGQR
jgi:hypothetical protein